tara:strand:+ start:296 stop:520 length:225 start_codon:yes stop_codon:yes gene_type:complete
MKHHIVLLGSLFFIGTVDFIESDMARVELRANGKLTHYSDIPIALFPCEISEGSLFYVEIIDGVTEIRCGEPPE